MPQGCCMLATWAILFTAAAAVVLHHTESALTTAVMQCIIQQPRRRHFCTRKCCWLLAAGSLSLSRKKKKVKQTAFCSVYSGSTRISSFHTASCGFRCTSWAVHSMMMMMHVISDILRTEAKSVILLHRSKLASWHYLLEYNLPGNRFNCQR